MKTCPARKSQIIYARRRMSVSLELVFHLRKFGISLNNLLAELAEKNLRFGEKLTHMGQRTTRAKIMSYLSAEAQRLGTCEFDIPFSRQQLADYLGVERSGLSLELGRMKKDGVLEYRKSHFLLRI